MNEFAYSVQDVRSGHMPRDRYNAWWRERGYRAMRPKVLGPLANTILALYSVA